MSARYVISGAALLAVAGVIDYFAGAIVPSRPPKRVVAQRLGAGFDPAITYRICVSGAPSG